MWSATVLIVKVDIRGKAFDAEIIAKLIIIDDCTHSGVTTASECVSSLCLDLVYSTVGHQYWCYKSTKVDLQNIKMSPLKVLVLVYQQNSIMDNHWR